MSVFLHLPKWNRPVSISQIFWIALIAMCCSFSSHGHSIVDIVEKVKPSIVGIGVYDPINAPRANLHGSGFVIADGKHIITNNHVINKPLAENSRQKRVVFVGQGRKPITLDATVVKVDELHDLALLRVERKLTPMKLASKTLIKDGTEIIFTGFPIGAVLGLYPATHKGIIAATTPVIIPANHSSQLDIKTVRRLRDPYFIYQLDATAYPGNSGSAVYAANSGEVVAVINKVFVKTTKEAVLSDPSGITYAIPVKYVLELLKEANIPLN